MLYMLHDTYPRQNVENVGLRIMACFAYDTKHRVPGTIVRNDKERPSLTILRLDDGRTVLGTECSWKHMTPEEIQEYPEPTTIKPRMSMR